MLISHVKPVVIWVLRRIKILIVILDEFVDLIEVVRIKMFALYAKVPFDRFSKELRFVSVGLGDFGSVMQSRIIALTLWLKKVFDFLIDTLRLRVILGQISHMAVIPHTDFKVEIKRNPASDL